MIDAVVFDLDGTLYDYDACDRPALTRVFQHITETSCHVDQDISNLYAAVVARAKASNSSVLKFNKTLYFKMLLEELCVLTKCAPDYTKVLECVEIYESTFLQHLSMFDDVLAVLDLCRPHGIRIGLASNNISQQQLRKLAHLGILSRFTMILTSDEAGEEKPQDGFFMMLAHKMKVEPSRAIFVGDDWEKDVLPARRHGFVPFHFRPTADDASACRDTTVEKTEACFHFRHYRQLHTFLCDYLARRDELCFLSKLFGQSVQHVQGQGGNTSVKMEPDLLLIKSSGTCLANMSGRSGVCVIDRAPCMTCVESVDATSTVTMDTVTTLRTAKRFGDGAPSMESFFHAFLKRYTVHLHMSAVLMLSDAAFDALRPFAVIIDYAPPGLALARRVWETRQARPEVDVFLLKNHGLVLTSDTIMGIVHAYRDLCARLSVMTDYDMTHLSFDISFVVHAAFSQAVVCRPLADGDEHVGQYFFPIKYCFPDLAVFVRRVAAVGDAEEVAALDAPPDVLVVAGRAFVLAPDLHRLQNLLDMLHIYITICERLGFENVPVIDEERVRRMPEEQFRHALL